jgi:hypothetical protein
VDKIVSTHKLAKSLFHRGMQRSLWNPTIGTFRAFITFIFLVRIAADIFIVVNIAGKGAQINTVQIASVILVFLAAYAVCIESLATFRVSFALPQLSFIDITPGARRFKNRFLRHVAIYRPMNIVIMAFILIAAVLFSAVSGSWSTIAIRALVVLCCVLAGATAIISVASRIRPGRSDLQIFEILFLLILIALNPDIRSYNDQVVIIFSGFYISFEKTWQVGTAIGLVTSGVLAVLLLTKIRPVFGTYFRRRTTFSPMEGWYWRFVRVKNWVLYYLIVIPMLISELIPRGTSRWVLILFEILTAVSYLYFIASSENSLREKWRYSLFEKGNVRLIMKSGMIHIVLMLVPVAVYFAVK